MVCSLQCIRMPQFLGVLRISFLSVTHRSGKKIITTLRQITRLRITFTCFLLMAVMVDIETTPLHIEIPLQHLCNNETVKLSLYMETKTRRPHSPLLCRQSSPVQADYSCGIGASESIEQLPILNVMETHRPVSVAHCQHLPSANKAIWLARKIITLPLPSGLQAITVTAALPGPTIHTRCHNNRFKTTCGSEISMKMHTQQKNNCVLQNDQPEQSPGDPL